MASLSPGLLLLLGLSPAALARQVPAPPADPSTAIPIQADPTAPVVQDQRDSTGDLSRLPGRQFRSPGMPFRTGQTSRFTSAFNPAMGAVFDALATGTEVDQGGEDGFDFSLRTFEINLNSFIDPNTWGYAVIVADEGESVELEEAAVQYIGWNSNATLRAGRFFVDFGKQMQAHVHDLPYVNRPLVLREYLGEELAGTGVQLDNWFVAGDETTIRYSIGAFQTLAGGHHHGEEEHEGEEELGVGPDGRRQVDELSFTARLTGMTDVGDQGVLQLGLSGRFLPSFSFEDEESGAALEDLSNTVWGLDATYGWVGTTGQERFTLGAEYLVFDGDLSGELDEVSEEIEAYDGTASGYYTWAEYAWNPRNSVGLLFSQADHPEEGGGDDEEASLYYTWHLSEFSRLRFQLDKRFPAEGPDETVFLVQFVNFFGAHAHGLNW